MRSVKLCCKEKFDDLTNYEQIGAQESKYPIGRYHNASPNKSHQTIMLFGVSESHPTLCLMLLKIHYMMMQFIYITLNKIV